MTADAVGICVTIGVGILIGAVTLGFAVFFGLRGFTKDVRKDVSEAKSAIVGQLSEIRKDTVEHLTAIQTTVTKLDTLADKAWTLASAQLTLGEGTVELELTHFGKTTVTARPRSEKTVYHIKVTNREHLDPSLMDKLTKSTGFQKVESSIVSDIPRLEMVSGNTIQYSIASTNPEICADLVSRFLKWMDTEFVSARQAEIEAFERDIKV